ncbi:hypothetical protein CCMSSC00406_0002527 [Pleurotus cornucopiae]|uniref:Uncharacterized protein n=1 Tax=Pleurotus cornucopiae TaxID=5321 RepID=A0ACB7ITM5_PLECO|nr:hypothetical protein CCMSSC00406_0002527 [Pleurotus cornucopiae]
MLSLSAAIRRAPRWRRAFTVLALESSADDTCAAVVDSCRNILSNVVIKQHDLHETFGGIHPTVAIEAHQRNMPRAIRTALSDARLSVNDVDGIAYTRGPGIGGCLSVGSNAAKNIAAALNKPLVGVHHMQAHALTPLLTSPPRDSPEFPYLTILVSGGHTLLLLATSLTKFRILATTADESIGRTFDKVGRILEMQWGTHGPAASLEHFASLALPEEIANAPAFPRPFWRKPAFSYASLHSTVERHVHSLGGVNNLDVSARRGLAHAFQKSAVDQLEDKLSQALLWCANHSADVRGVVVSGGVASNQYLRSRLDEFCLEQSLRTFFPPVSLCTDNAAMIAWASMHRFLGQDHDSYEIELRPKWSIEDI